MYLSIDFERPVLGDPYTDLADFSLTAGIKGEGSQLVAQAGGLSYAQERSGCIALFGDVMNELEHTFNIIRPIWEHGG